MERTDFREAVASQLTLIEEEMKASGFWQTQPLGPEQLEFSQAFGMDTMTFQQWLQFIFVPRVREAIASNSFPKGSQVGAQAVRDFDSVPEANRLTSLLSEFDALFENGK